MSNKDIFIMWLWVITALVVMLYMLWSIVSQKKEISLFEIIGGAITIAFFVPAFWVMGIIFILNKIKFGKLKPQ